MSSLATAVTVTVTVAAAAAAYLSSSELTWKKFFLLRLVWLSSGGERERCSSSGTTCGLCRLNKSPASELTTAG